MPGIQGILTGEEEGSAPLSVIEDFEEKAVLIGREGGQTPVVDEGQVDFGQFLEQGCQTAVGLSDPQLPKELGYTI